MKKKTKWKIGMDCLWNEYECKLVSTPLKTKYGVFVILEFDSEECRPDGEYKPKRFRARVPIEQVNLLK